MLSGFWRVCRFTTLLDQFHFNYNVILNKWKSDRKSDRESDRESDRIGSKNRIRSDRIENRIGSDRQKISRR